MGIPFVASGGAATGAQLAAALAMGAEGLNMGTLFMVTKEAPIQQGIKEALVKAKVTDTLHLLRSLGNAERVFKNDVSLKVKAIEAEKPGDIDAIYPFIKGENYRKSFQDWRRFQLGVVLRSVHRLDQRHSHLQGVARPNLWGGGGDHSRPPDVEALSAP